MNTEKKSLFTDAHIHVLRDAEKGVFSSELASVKAFFLNSASEKDWDEIQSAENDKNNKSAKFTANETPDGNKTSAVNKELAASGESAGNNEYAGNKENGGNACFGRVKPFYGIHPWWISSVQPGWDVRLAERLERNPTAGVGEIGLDWLRKEFQAPEKRAIQLEIFSRQLKLAVDFHRPVSLHCVRAWDVMWEPLRKIVGRSRIPILFHAFSGTAENLVRFSKKNGFYAFYSFAPFTFLPESSRFQRLLPLLSFETLLLETDADMLADAQKLPDFYQTAAETLRLEPEKLSEITFRNSRAFFE